MSFSKRSTGHTAHVTNLGRGAKNIVRFYNHRGAAEQMFKGKNAPKWRRLSCHDFVDKHVHLQLFALPTT